jgi:hypothetical protein
MVPVYIGIYIGVLFTGTSEFVSVVSNPIANIVYYILYRSFHVISTQLGCMLSSRYA